MTLKKYTGLILLLHQILEILDLLETTGLPKEVQIKIDTGLTNGPVPIQDGVDNLLLNMLSFENWEKFVLLFYEKIGFKRKGTSFTMVGITSHMLRNERKIFFVTLAEFCEPLIERPTEKPEENKNPS